MEQRGPTMWQRIITIAVLLTSSLVVSCSRSTPEPPTPTLSPSLTPSLAPTPTPIPTATPTQPPAPAAPVITPADKTDVVAGHKLSVRARAEGATSYAWTLQGDGEISSKTDATILYIAPEEAVQGGTMAILTVVASNDYGESSPTYLEINVVPSERATIALDALGHPAGWMSGGEEPASFIELASGAQNCPPDAEAACWRVTYKPGGGWGGIYWWPPSCGEEGTPEAWEKVKSGACGVNVLDIGNVTTVEEVIFRARGEQGGEVIEFRVGSADVAPMPGRSTGKVTLAREWQQYALDLENVDLTNAVGLFFWVAADIDNPEGAVFYLDSIQFEGVR